MSGADGKAFGWMVSWYRRGGSRRGGWWRGGVLAGLVGASCGPARPHAGALADEPAFFDAAVESARSLPAAAPGGGGADGGRDAPTTDVAAVHDGGAEGGATGGTAGRAAPTGAAGAAGAGGKDRGISSTGGVGAGGAGAAGGGGVAGGVGGGGKADGGSGPGGATAAAGGGGAGGGTTEGRSAGGGKGGLAGFLGAEGGGGRGGGGGEGNGAAPAPLAGDLAIVELLTNPAGTDTGREWIEIANTTGHDLSLLGLHVADAANDAAVVFAAASGHLLRVGHRAVLIQSADPVKNGGVDFAAGFAGGSFGTLVSLNNDTDTLTVCVGSCATGTVIDRAAWAGGDLGTAYEGHALSIDDAGRHCPATQSFGDAGSFGSPGAANPPCPP